MIDERFTSKIAIKTLVESNTKKNKRQDKTIIDKISTTLILHYFLDRSSL